MIYGVEDSRFTKTGTDMQEYFIRKDGISCSLTIKTIESGGMKIFLSIRNNDYVLITYDVNRLTLSDAAGEKNIAAVYVDNQKADKDYKCKIYQTDLMNLLYIVEDSSGDKIGTEYTLSLGTISIAGKHTIEINDIKITSRLKE